MLCIVFEESALVYVSVWHLSFWNWLLFGVEDSGGTILTATPTHEDLANSIGASRQKVTECLAELKREHGVRQDGRRLIVVL